MSELMGTDKIYENAGVYIRANGSWGFTGFEQVEPQISYDEGADIDDGTSDDEK